MIDPGTIIDGRYRVLSRIGSGGMADVYLVEDELLGRQVAVKVLHHHFAEDQEFVERFRREASSAAALSHPNIVGIFDRGEWNGTYYIAMEHVAGRSLKTLVRETGPLEPAEAIDIVIQILRAARFAHRRGVIHRDLKPHNVIVDEEGRARVTDFGIARAGASDMTLTGSIMGTAQYLSPEQAQGLAVSAASDIYSVGVILYELLTGTVPFEGETAVAIAFKQVSAAPRAPSELNPAIPATLDAIVLRALAKDPAERYADADELITALEHERQTLPALSGVAYSLGHPAPSARPATAPLMMAPAAAPALDEDSPEEQERRRRSLLWGLLAALLVALALAAFFLLRSGTTTVRVPDVVRAPQRVAVERLRAVGLVASTTVASSATVPAGLVISSSPPPGARADKGSRVALLVSGGPATIPVVDVTGMTEAQALARLRAAGFKPVSRAEASAGVAGGRVIATEPSAGRRAAPGSRVTVLVSSGPAPVKVPDVRGESLAGARSTLGNAGLSVGTITRRASSSQPPGTVLSQSPPAGSSVKGGAKIDLTVAKAPTEATVPDVVGKSEAEAAGALGEAGFKPKTVPTSTTNAEQVEKVITQSPSPGGRARKGSTVTIGIGVLSTPTTPTTPTTTPSTTTTPPPGP